MSGESRVRTSVACRGNQFTIEYARLSNGAFPGLDFFNSLEARWQARICTLYQRLADHGRIQNTEMFKKEEQGFYAFKAYQVRLLCYFHQGRRVVVTHGFIKKSDKMSRGEIDRAARIKQEYEEILSSADPSRRG